MNQETEGAQERARITEPSGPDVVAVIDLDYLEEVNIECSDGRYGCTCIRYEKCCGCLIQ